jgi:hypothetical protein
MSNEKKSATSMTRNAEKGGTRLFQGTGRDQPAKSPEADALACTNRALIHEVEAIEVSF